MAQQNLLQTAERKQSKCNTFNMSVLLYLVANSVCNMVTYWGFLLDDSKFHAFVDGGR